MAKRYVDPHVKAFVDGKIAGKKVVVFSKSGCPYCKKAKAVLKEYNISGCDYGIEEIDSHKDQDVIQDYLHNLTGARSVPRVFINQRFVGGGDDIVRLHNNGQLASLILSRKG